MGSKSFPFRALYPKFPNLRSRNDKGLKFAQSETDYEQQQEQMKRSRQYKNDCLKKFFGTIFLHAFFKLSSCHMRKVRNAAVVFIPHYF